MKRIVLCCLLILSTTVHAEVIPESEWPALCDSIFASNRRIRSGSGSIVYEYVLIDTLRARQQMEEQVLAMMQARQRPDYMSLPDSLRPGGQRVERPAQMVHLVTLEKKLFEHVFAIDTTDAGFFLTMPSRLEATNLLDEDMGVMKHIYAWDGVHMQRLVHHKASDGSIHMVEFLNEPHNMDDAANYNLLYYNGGMFEMAYLGGELVATVPNITGCSREVVNSEPRIIIEITTTYPDHPDISKRDVFTLLPEKQYRPIRIESQTTYAGDSPGRLEIITISYRETGGIWIPKHVDVESHTLEDGEIIPNITRALEFQDDWRINIDIDPATFTIEFPEKARIMGHSSGR